MLFQSLVLHRHFVPFCLHLPLRFCDVAKVVTAEQIGLALTADTDDLLNADLD